MIISRFDIRLIDLYNDPDVRPLFDDFFENNGCRKEINDLYKSPKFYNKTLRQRDMGWCIPGEYLGKLIDLCEKLDEIKPYDNGFRLCDTRKIIPIYDPLSSENAISFELLFSDEGQDYLIQSIRLIYKDGKYIAESITD